jgi:TolB-like protein
MQTPSPEAVRSQLQKILASPGFERNERLSGFLRFILDQELSGRGGQLKESIVGVEVFGRTPDYDVRLDSVVRTEAAKLRDRLAKYYSGEGLADTLVIDVPKGRYRPAFSLKQVEAAKSGPRSRAWLWAAVAVATLAVVSGVWRLLFFQRPQIPLAVLPLRNLSPDQANDDFADGLTSEIIHNLSLIEGMAVRSQTSSFALKARTGAAGGPDIHEVGRRLQVDYVLEGTVLRSGEHLRIDTQLVRVRDDFALWSGRYDRQLVDIFAIQDEISSGIVNSLRLKLGQGRRRYETSTEAYDLYLRARAKLAMPLTTGMRDSVEPFEQAIAKDPSFAPAYAGLASALAAMSGFDISDRQNDLEKMRDTAAKAIQLDPLLAEAHDALAIVQARDAEWAESEQSFRRSIELDPNSARSHSDLAGNLLFPLGRLKEASEQVRIALKLDPLSDGIQAGAAMVLQAAGLYQEAAMHCQPQSGCTAACLVGEGKVDQAIQILEPIFKGKEKASGAQGLGAAYARAGRRSDAESVAELVPRPLGKATVFAALGDKERTIGALEQATALGPVRVGRWLARRDSEFLRNDSRVQALRHNVGLP